MLMTRGLKIALSALAGLVLVVGVGVGSVLLASMYLSSQKTECEEAGKKYLVTIEDSVVTPKHIDAQLCDTLTITNNDDTERLMAFGEHDKHVAYDNVSQRYLSKGQSIEVTLVEAGDYLFHDHNDDEVLGTFSVVSN